MFLDKSNVRVSASVSVLLVLAFAGTGFISRAYKTKKAALGELHYVAGQQLEKKSELEGAVEEYRKALIYSPDKQEYASSFASALLEAGKLDEAESHLDQLLQADPTNGALNLMRGRIAAKRKETTKAIDFYERAVYEYWPSERADDRRKARWELVGLLDQTGRREEGVAELMTMYANAPGDPQLRMRIGTELLRRSATSEGLQVFRDMVRLKPKEAKAHEGLGEALMASGDFVSARHEFERALRLEPKDRPTLEALQQTNVMIDLSPEMPGLTAAERYRRSQNLLRRVLSDFGQQCSGSETGDEFIEAKELLEKSLRNDPDAALHLQSAAARLWNQRMQLCGSHQVPTDPTVAMVLERMANE